MFGHDDQTAQNNDTAAPVADANLDQNTDQNTNGKDDAQSAPALGADTGTTTGSDYIMTDTSSPQASTTDAAGTDGLSTAGDDATPASTSGTTVAPDQEELLSIKQQALQQLTPLVGHLDQTPEEKFRTTMMMIQAADNDALIKEAYTAAGQITDEKARAQALLDIVNEINYFTQNQTNDQPT